MLLFDASSREPVSHIRDQVRDRFLLESAPGKPARASLQADGIFSRPLLDRPRSCSLYAARSQAAAFFETAASEDRGGVAQLVRARES
jgi:hypothetical protein